MAEIVSECQSSTTNMEFAIHKYYRTPGK